VSQHVLLQRLSSSGGQHDISSFGKDKAALGAKSVTVLDVDEEPVLRFRLLHASADAPMRPPVALSSWYRLIRSNISNSAMPEDFIANSSQMLSKIAL